MIDKTENPCPTCRYYEIRQSLLNEIELIDPPPWNMLEKEELTEKYIEVMKELRKYNGYIQYAK